MDEKIDQHDVAKYLGVSTRTVRNLIKRGELPPLIRIGRKQFWLKDKFTGWLRDSVSAQMGSARSEPNPVMRRSKQRSRA